MTDYETTVAGLSARTDLPPHRLAATVLLLWNESWLRRADFRRRCLITNPVGIHWPAVREFHDEWPRGASSSQMTVLRVALMLAEDEFGFGALGHAHRRAAAEAFATALGQRLEPAAPVHNHPKFIPGAFSAWRKGGDLPGELADVLIFLVSLAQMTGVDLDGAVQRKMAANAARVYVRLPNGTPVKAEAGHG